MGLNDTVSADRIHISFFGKRNAGKSSLVNAFTNQELSVVSDFAGTTTDPVKKAMELLPLGPVLIIDTPGFDDTGELGTKRVEKAREILSKTDIAILVVDATEGLSDTDKELISLFDERSIKYIIAYNKNDLAQKSDCDGENTICVSALTKENINELRILTGKLLDIKSRKKYIVADLFEKGDTAVLVIPIDESAPKGRLILPQQQTIRELLDYHLNMSVTQVEELKDTLDMLNKKPRLVITDSQAFKEVSKIVPDDVPLTSFSILFARYKGNLETLISGAKALDNLKDGDHVLISEGCTHHRQCNDIGTVKIPSWIEGYTDKKLVFDFTQGGEYPKDLSKYSLIVHCGGCMLNEKEMNYRVQHAKESGIPMINYGMLIAHINGILKRSLSPFDGVNKQLEKNDD